MTSTEKPTQKAVMDFLALKHILHWRNQSGQIPMKDGLGRIKSMMRFGVAGSPDIYALHNGTLYGFEIKDIKGRQNPNQVWFEKRFNDAGGKYLVIRDVLEVVCIFGALPVEPKPPPTIQEIPSCGHKRKIHWYAPMKKTLCIKCIDGLET